MNDVHRSRERFEPGEWGWDDDWETLFEASREAGEPTRPARVVAEHRTRWRIQTPIGPREARIAGSFRGRMRPTVGDWLAAKPPTSPPASASVSASASAGAHADEPWTIEVVLPRRSSFSRGSALDGSTEQVLASNIDRVWIVHGLDAPLNVRRLERYLTVAWESGASPEIVLTKSDLAADPATAVEQAQAIGFGAPVRVVGQDDEGSLSRLAATLMRGVTIALLGPSGVGKSTLVNRLAGDRVAPTGSVRPGDRKGRHTSTTRELFELPGGALLLDTPGLRQLRVWDLDEGLARAFPDIDELARGCRFRDCRHEAEPGCAVLAAVEGATLDAERLGSFRKLEAEAAHQRRKTDPVARSQALADIKAAMKTLRHHPKYQGQKE